MNRNGEIRRDRLTPHNDMVLHDRWDLGEEYRVNEAC